MSTIDIVEVGPRDGLQNEAVVVDTDTKVEFISRCFPGPSTAGTPVGQVTDLKKNQVANFAHAGAAVWVSRTGYTGEDGFELFCPAAKGAGLWDALIDAGRADGLVPAGLGARDSLRLESAYRLYGSDMDDETTPLEAGLAWVVKLEKGDFVGRDALLRQKAAGLPRKLVGFALTDPGGEPTQAAQRIQAQLPIQRKVELADYVLWTEGGLGVLREQLRRILRPDRP